MTKKYWALAFLSVALPAGIIVMVANIPHGPGDVLRTAICVVPLGIAGLVGCCVESCVARVARSVGLDKIEPRPFPTPRVTAQGNFLAQVAIYAVGPGLAVVGAGWLIRLRWSDVPTTAWFYLSILGGVGLAFLGATLHVWALRSKGRAWLTQFYDRATLPAIILLALLTVITFAVLCLVVWLS